MPTLLTKNGFKFFFYANEHMPKHIHVIKGDNYAKIELLSLTVVENYFNKSDIKKVMEITEEYQNIFLEKWDEFFKR